MIQAGDQHCPVSPVNSHLSGSGSELRQYRRHTPNPQLLISRRGEKTCVRMLLDTQGSYNSYMPSDLGLHYSLQSPSSSPSYYSQQNSPLSPFTPASSATESQHFIFPSEAPADNPELYNEMCKPESDLWRSPPHVTIYNDGSKDEWRSAPGYATVSVPASPSGCGYSGLYMPDSPLLSQSSEAVHYNSIMNEHSLRYNSTPNIPETVRYSGSALPSEDTRYHSDDTNLAARYQDQSFGHSVPFNMHSQQAYYQPSSNFQVCFHQMSRLTV